MRSIASLIIGHKRAITNPSLDRAAISAENTPAPGLRPRENFGAFEAKTKYSNVNRK
jgi:hypothetical protein